MTFLPQEIIRKKRSRQTLTGEEIGFFVKGITDGSIADAQTAALTMAIFLNGFSRDETVALTLNMRDSGDVLQWPDIDGPVVDKHSSGGVGDKVSLMLAPMIAACGGVVPMIPAAGSDIPAARSTNSIPFPAIKPRRTTTGSAKPFAKSVARLSGKPAIWPRPTKKFMPFATSAAQLNPSN